MKLPTFCMLYMYVPPVVTWKMFPGENKKLKKKLHFHVIQSSNSLSRSDYAPATVNAFYSPLQNQIRKLFEVRSIFLHHLLRKLDVAPVDVIPINSLIKSE